MVIPPSHGIVAALPNHSMRTKHPENLIQLGIIRADHPAFDGTKVVRVIKREIRHPTERAHFSAAMGGPVRFANVFDQRNVLASKLSQQLIRQGVVTQYMG